MSRSRSSSFDFDSSFDYDFIDPHAVIPSNSGSFQDLDLGLSNYDPHLEPDILQQQWVNPLAMNIIALPPPPPTTSDIYINSHIPRDYNYYPNFRIIAPSIETIPIDTEPIRDRIDLAIRTLQLCDANKIWQKQPIGRYVDTCGYTGPGIAILLLYFEELGIDNNNQLMTWLSAKNMQPQTFFDIINETIANMLDLAVGHCPLTGVNKGIQGLIQIKSPNLTLVDYHSITPGVNLISFINRDHCYTSHHAVLYSIPQHNTCIIIDSWAAAVGESWSCRPVTSRTHNLEQVCNALIYLNTSNDLGLIQTIMNEFFVPSQQYLLSPYPVTVFKVNSLYINYIRHLAYEQIVTYNIGTRMGGRVKHYTNKKRKNIKRIKKTRHSHK